MNPTDLIADAALESIPNVGPKIAAELQRLGFTSRADLAGQDPYEMYDRLCKLTHKRHDPCLLDVFIAAVAVVDGEPAQPWWKYTEQRKAELRRREQ